VLNVFNMNSSGATFWPMLEQEKKTLLRRYADYFRKAEEAEAAAEIAHDDVARNSFHMIALGWRRLAEQVKQRLRRP